MEITGTCVEYTDSVLVQGDMSEVSDDALMLYLTNKKRSRGGEVKSFTWVDRRKSVVVAFEDCHGMCIIILVSGLQTPEKQVQLANISSQHTIRQ